MFGRMLNDRGITLVDWEGHIANPAVRLTVRFAKEDRWHVTLKSDEARLYFDLPSETGAEGPRKNLSLTTTAPAATFYLAIFPDRDTRNETHRLEIRYSNGGSWTGETIDIHVIDQDVDRAHDFDIIVDYSQDKTGLFDDPSAVRAVQQAADDWAYFLAGMDLDRTPARQEPTWIWSPGGFTGGGVVQNQYAYTGFLLYAYGSSMTSSAQVASRRTRVDSNRASTSPSPASGKPKVESHPTTGPSRTAHSRTASLWIPSREPSPAPPRRRGSMNSQSSSATIANGIRGSQARSISP